jgi:hypothetical protein
MNLFLHRGQKAKGHFELKYLILQRICDMIGTFFSLSVCQKMMPTH